MENNTTLRSRKQATTSTVTEKSSEQKFLRGKRIAATAAIIIDGDDAGDTHRSRPSAESMFPRN